MSIKSQKDFFAGLMFMGAGVAFAWGASSYPIGTSTRMEPGYFPLALGVLLAILGSVITFKALVVETFDGDKIGAFAWRPLIFIVLANLVFGAMVGGLPGIHLPPMGLIAGVYALTIIACVAGDKFNLKEAVVLATILAALSYLAFIKLLNLQFPVWPVLPGV